MSKTQPLNEDPRVERIIALAAKLPETTHSLRLGRGRIDWKEVANLLELSYCLAAPKKLAAQMQEAPSKPAAKRKRR